MQGVLTAREIEKKSEKSKDAKAKRGGVEGQKKGSRCAQMGSNLRFFLPPQTFRRTCICNWKCCCECSGCLFEWENTRRNKVNNTGILTFAHVYKVVTSRMFTLR